MNSFISRVACAAVLATAMSAGFLAMSSAAAIAQVSPADPNYDYETRGKTIPWNGADHAQVPANQGWQGGADARASAGGKGVRSRGHKAPMRR